MFYEDNGKIYPAIITSDYYEMKKDLLIQQKIDIKKKRDSGDPHSSSGYRIMRKNSLLFLYDIFGDDNIRYGKKLIEPDFGHNAIPMKISDIEEIYKYIKNYYEHANIILNEKERSLYDLQYQTLYWAFVKNKYNRKVYKIPSEYYDINQSNKVLENKKRLFVINTSSRNYNQVFYTRERDVLGRLFPTKTKYELGGEDQKDKKENIEPKIIIEPIINSFVNELNKNLKIDSEKILSNIQINKAKNLLEGKIYTKLLMEEIKNMKEFCFWHEIFNYILVSFFVLMIVFRYFSKGYLIKY